jgi:hypothetical protein
MLGDSASLTHVVLSVQQSTMKPDRPWQKSAISSSAGRASDAFLVRRISCFIDRLFARWVSGV